MGALTSNRKRGDDYCTSNYKSPNSHSLHVENGVATRVSKKLKTLSSMHPHPESVVSSKSAASRIHRYPEPASRIRREVHAPCRASRFRSWLSSAGVRQDRFADATEKALSFNYHLAKNKALASLRYVKDEEVIDVDAETDKVPISDDSSIEEFEVVEDGREGRLVVSEQRWQDTNGVGPSQPPLDAKVLDRSLQLSSSPVLSDLTTTNFKVENATKLLDSLSLNRDLEVIDLPTHKKLLKSVENRNSKLSNLDFEIKVTERRVAKLQSLRSVKKLKEEDVCKDLLGEPFVPLTKEEEDEMSQAFLNSNRRRVLVTHENSNIEISGQILQCLRPNAWLNDEVINVYLELLKEREKREPKRFLKCHFFNTFFYKKLISGRNGYDFKSVRRWTTQRKLGYCLIECDKIFVPIHKEIHWVLAVINKKDEKFQYLDSLGGIDTQALKVLARYFVDEVKDKSGTEIDVSSWKQEYVQDLPQQENGWDCGMFMIKYADFYSRGLSLCFNQEHMPYFRLRTAKEILRLKAE